MSFIDDIAKYVQKYAPQYNICVYSPIIAQAILESAMGTSELAKNCNNFFGLKYKAGRCKTALPTPYEKNGSEQLPDGSYVIKKMYWFQFPDMENGVIGYFDFTNIPNYANLKGVTDPETYLKNIKADGYATSLKYVDNLMAVINKYNLTQYDPQQPGPTPPPTPTTYTQKDFITDIQKVFGIGVDGIAGPQTLGATITVSMKINYRHPVVVPMQKYLNALGYDVGDADGWAGSLFDKGLKAFQKANGCVADGEATAKAKTWQKLIGYPK